MAETDRSRQFRRCVRPDNLLSLQREIPLDEEISRLKTSHPTLVAASRAVVEQRDAMVSRWIEWLGERITRTPAASREVVDAEFRMIIDVFSALVGPLRREVRPIWARVAERYGRHAAARGLAAGEVVEEMQYLRELLIRHLAPAIAALRPRQGMALLLRLNRLVDKGVAMAVIGYTDAMVSTLILSEDGHGEPLPNTDDVQSWVDGFRAELETILRAQPS